MFCTRSRKLASVSTETISLTELRPRLSEAVERVRERYDRFLISRHGRVEAVLLAADELEGLLETLEILSDEALVRRLGAAERELAEGVGLTLAALRREIEGGG